MGLMPANAQIVGPVATAAVAPNAPSALSADEVAALQAAEIAAAGLEATAAGGDFTESGWFYAVTTIAAAYLMYYILSNAE